MDRLFVSFVIFCKMDGRFRVAWEMTVGLWPGKSTLRDMKSLTVQLPDPLADEVARRVRDGWFQTETELVRAALVEFLHTRQAEPQERFQREAIAWAVAEAEHG